jgi:hypothetical protein
VSLEGAVDPAVLESGLRQKVPVKKPQPLAIEEWGDTSNAAHILVPFAFTKIVTANMRE